MKKTANGIWKLTIADPEPVTPTALRQFPPSAALEEMDAAEIPPSQAAELSWQLTGRGLTITLPMKQSEDIYGFGLQLRHLNQAGRKRHIKVNSDPPADTGEGHAPAPFYISTAGYGLFVDTCRYTTFYMGTGTRRGSSRDHTEENINSREFSETALYALRRAKEERTVIIDIPGVRGVDLYFFSGGVKEICMRYNLFSGGGCLPPMWGLGMWYRSYGGSAQKDVLALADQFRREEIPIDVIGLEPGWHSHSYSCTYRWSALFSDPGKMIDTLAERGYKLNLWEHIFVYPACELYESLLPFSGDYEVWNGLVPDFASKEACDLFEEHHRNQFVKNGVKGFKLDECDNSDYNASNWSFPDTAQFPSGLDGEQMHTAVGILYQNLIYRIFHDENTRTYSQVRSSGALAAPLPFVLYSDLYEHKQFIRGIVTSGFSGLLWAPEVRSCTSGRDLLRRMETIIFSAHALFNSWRIPSPPWKQVDIEKNLAGEWMEDQEYYTDVCRRYARLRMSLLPYLYSAFMEYHRKGLPPLRALVMDYPDDPEVRNLDDEYLFGDSLLVAPLTLEDGVSRKVYLPNGTWYGFFTDEVFKGGRAYEINADYDEIPVFVKDNTLLPLADPVEFVGKDTVFEISVKTYGTGAAAFVLYEDDFESFEYEKGKFNRVVIRRELSGELSYERIGKERSRYRIALPSHITRKKKHQPHGSCVHKIGTL